MFYGKAVILWSQTLSFGWAASTDANEGHTHPGVKSIKLATPTVAGEVDCGVRNATRSERLPARSRFFENPVKIMLIAEGPRTCPPMACPGINAESGRRLFCCYYNRAWP